MGSGFSPEGTSKAWGLQPSASVLGKCSASFALWRLRHSGSVERSGLPDCNTNILCWGLRGHISHNAYYDGTRRVFAGQFSAGNSHVVRAGELPRAINTDCDVDLIHVYLPNESLVSAATEIGAAGIPELCPRQYSRDHALDAIMNLLVQELAYPDALSSLMVDHVSAALALHLLRSRSTWSAKRSRAVGALAPWQVERIKDFLLSRLSDELSLAGLAAELGISPFHFARGFRHATGMPPFEFQRQLRVARAKELLRGTSLSVEEIAAEVGYTGSAFSRLFSRMTGVSPSRFRGIG